jgi:hypothetical protein
VIRGLARRWTRAGGGRTSARASFHRGERCYNRSIALRAAEVSTQFRKGDVSEGLDRLLDINLPSAIARDAPRARRSKYIPSIPERREGDWLDHDAQNSPPFDTEAISALLGTHRAAQSISNHDPKAAHGQRHRPRENADRAGR